MEKITFLKQYRKNIELVSSKDILNIKDEDIPKYWLDIIKDMDKISRKEKLISLWKHICGEELSNTISYLTENLIDIELIIDNEKYAILYSVMSENEEVLYYEGGIPSFDRTSEEVKENWSKIPTIIKSFYEKLHNGFYYYPSRAMGLVPLENITSLKEHEWGILDDLEEPLGINIDSTFGFFENGMGGYVVIDVENCSNNTGTIWFTNDQPDYHLNFWDIVDEWIVIGLQDN